MDESATAGLEMATRVYRARKTVLEMLRDRGYHIPKARTAPSLYSRTHSLLPGELDFARAVSRALRSRFEEGTVDTGLSQS